MIYRLGYYDMDGEPVCERTVSGKDEEAKRNALLAYNYLKSRYECTIWVQKCEYVKPEEEFK